MTVTITTPRLQVDVDGAPDHCWTYRVTGSDFALSLAAPEFELDGQPTTAAFIPSAHSQRSCPNGVVEHHVDGALHDRPDVSLRLTVRVADDDPIVRFRYRLTGAPSARLTKRAGADAASYLAVDLTGDDQLTEVRLSEFDELAHTFRPLEQSIPAQQQCAGATLMGPLLAARRGRHSFVFGYEHGSQVPDAFCAFVLSPTRLRLAAVKGTYLTGQTLPYTTVWCQVGAVDGDLDVLAAQYRRFVLTHLSEHAETRRAQVFYNSWALQERTKWWRHGNYLDPMRADRMLAEVDVAHQIGVDVFVLDTGWYVKTGDWQVNTDRFGANLASVTERLDRYGMRLGLWFGPMDAAVSAAATVAHPEYQVSWRGVRRAPRPVWETEDSVRMCVVSGYGDLLAERLIELGRTLGVRYFKWDAIDQYGCDDPGHDHGGPGHTPAERAENYAYQLPLRLTAIADRICSAVPGAIVDFDVTEHRRAVGLAFLAAGKYFLINNRPYHSSLDQPDEPGRNPNVFFYPGPARAQVARTPLPYDRWIPTTLLLTHYLPDDPADSQRVNAASMMLGQNGLWGDLTAVTTDGVARLAELLGHYRRVRDDMAAVAAVRTGVLGGSPEIYEKIDPATGRGAVIAFSPTAGRYDYLTAAVPVARRWATEGVHSTVDASGRARLSLVFERPGAQVAFFG